MKRTRIIGTGSYVPAREVTNEELSRGLALGPDAIYRRTGIRTRRWAAEGETPALMAEHAARRACEVAGVPPESLDGILVSSTSPDTIVPSTACHLQRALGVQAVPAFDVAASCSGFLYGLSMAESMIKSGMARRVVVVAAEVKSRFLNLKDQATSILFADGAGAAILSVDGPADASSSELLGVRLYADGARHDLITVPAGGSRLPSTEETLEHQLHAIHMKGGPLFRVAVKRLTEAVKRMLKEFGLQVGDLKQVVFHQANWRLIEALGDRLNIPGEKLYSVIERYGNSSSASLPIAFDHAVRERRVVTGDLVLLGAFGGGLTWGTALVRW